MRMRILSLAVIILSIASFGYCANVNIGEVVDQYKRATDLQRQELEKYFIGKSLSAGGIVDNVGEYDFFDISNDTGGKYYKVLLRQQETIGNVPYQVVFLYKDIDSVKDINRGQAMEREGKIIKIVDERLQIAVWIYNGELTERERELFK
ncbi:MAG: hypothetical protein PHV48_01330 [Candidatus Omnitrophica bacterium]|nr:hypothetical protein [Candidatus Omnitrophota bacterium]